MASSDADKGWAWLIVLSTFIMCALTSGLPWAASGAYNVIFLKAFPESTAATVAWVTSLNAAASHLAGPVGSILVNRYGLRLPALVGGITAGTGFIISYFAPNVQFLFFSFGALTGVGLGIGNVSGISAIAHYIDKRLGLATGLSLCGSGVGMFIFAPLITTLDHVFGWRGSVLIVGGITLNMCVCGFMSRKNNRVETRRDDQSLFHWGLFRNFRFSLLVVNNLCVSFGISIVYVHLMAFAESRGFIDTQSAMLMSSIGIANLVARFTLPPATKFACLNVCILFCVCYTLSGVTAGLFLMFGYSYLALVILSVSFGFYTVSYGALLTILIVETVGVVRFANAFGYLVVFNGLGYMCGGAAAGFLLDITGNYKASLCTGGGMISLGGVVPLLSLCCCKGTPRTVEVDVVTMEERIPLPSSSLSTSDKQKD